MTGGIELLVRSQEDSQPNRCPRALGFGEKTRQSVPGGRLLGRFPRAASVLLPPLLLAFAFISAPASEWPTTVAVLQMNNMTADPAVAGILRAAVVEELKYRGYQPLEVRTVDARLAEIGLDHPGMYELEHITNIGVSVGAAFVMQGAVEQSIARLSGVRSDKAIVASLSLLDCATGEQVWHVEQRANAERVIAVDPVNLLIEAFRQRNDNLTNRVRALVHGLFEKEALPRGNVRVETGDSLLDGAVQVEAESEP